jgi:RNA polymerase sigma-70 factor (ECF subfamily)
MTNWSRFGQSTGVAPRAASPGVLIDRRIELRDVFDAHAAYVWNTLRRLGAPASDLEDLTHDVFVQVQRHLADYDLSRPIKPWLFGFAFRIYAQYRRRAKRRPESPSDKVDAVDPAALADERMAVEHDRRLVIAALDAIEQDRRAVFVLYELDGVPMDEIARTLGIPANTAYSRLRVARAEFKAAVVRLRRGER